MLVKNIIIKACEILNMNELTDELKSNKQISNIYLKDLDDLVFSLNLANINIATNYFLLKDSVNVSVKDCFLNYEDISSIYNINEILKIYSHGRIYSDYKIFPRGIKIKNGDYEIEFSYIPSDVDIDGVIDYYSNINEMMFACMLVSEYLFLKGFIDDSNDWNDKFKSLFNGLNNTHKLVFLPSKRWE